MIRFIAMILIMLMPPMAQAHGIIASVYPSGDHIEGEVALSNGTVAQNLDVIITADDGSILGRSKTDGDGFFSYTPTAPVTHHFTANMGAGHVAQLQMSAAEVAQILGQSPITQAAPTQTTAAIAPAASFDPALLQPLRDDIRAVRREVVAAKQERQLHSILGGIGYVLGLFGLGFYLTARRQLKAMK
jgi:nickel transport protein